MASLTQRRKKADVSTATPETDEASSLESSTPRSSTGDLKALDYTANLSSKGKTLQERGRIPYSFFVSFGGIFGLQYLSGMWSRETVESWYSSVVTSANTLKNLLGYTRDLTKDAIEEVSGDAPQHHWTEYCRTAVIFLISLSLIYVFFVAPFMAGLWTGRKARRHKFHRYMGLAYLIQYTLAAVEFFTNYDAARSSYLRATIAFTGMLQGASAYISFKVLPELEDPGYYSDKAVLSRNFVHENMFFTLMCNFGAIYYNNAARENLRSSLPGRILEYIFMFGPYVLVRPFYPVTRFSNAGNTHRGRSDKNLTFYKIGTLMVKFFYLWAKYFLGFFMNFIIFLDIVPEEHWRILDGMLLLNIGTVSLAVFLHTLRFKKVLPPKFTFSLYLVQIYLTFTALPVVTNMFISHPKLCAVCFTGLLGNATRSRKVHAVWAFCVMLLMSNRDVEW